MRRMPLGIPDQVDFLTSYLKGGRKFQIAEEHVQLMKGVRRYSWDIPPDVSSKVVTFNDSCDVSSKAVTFHEEVIQCNSVGGRKFSWDKPPNLTDVNEGSVKLHYMGGKHNRGTEGIPTELQVMRNSSVSASKLSRRNASPVNSMIFCVHS